MDSIVVAARKAQDAIVMMRHALGVALASITMGCAAPPVDGAEGCTVEAIGEETGAGALDATLHVPENFHTGAEISNGGISVFLGDCDFPLNAFFARETANYIIQNAPADTLVDKQRFFRLVDASLSIWKFSDGSGETRFFVTGIQEMKPILKPRTSHEAARYLTPSNAS